MSKELIGDLLQSITLYSACLENPGRHMARLSNAAHCIEELERQLYAEKERCDSYMEDNKRLAGERDALQADNARLREVLAWVRKVTVDIEMHDAIDFALATPEQSLARIRNQVLDEAINVAWNHEPDCNGPIEMALRALKEPE